MIADAHSLEAVHAFYKANSRALRYELWQSIRGRPSELLSFEEVSRALHLYGRTVLGVKLVPLKAIIGSVDRPGDFTRNFMPRKDHLKNRWARVYSVLTQQGFDPVSLYKVSEIYFVNDGNHRLSILSLMDTSSVEAEVIEFECRVKLDESLRASALPLKAAYTEFLEQTDLDRSRPGQSIELSQPASYRKLEEHIAGHAYWLEYSSGKRVSIFRAAASWYDLVYMPTVDVIRQHGALRHFRGLTEADLYVGLTEAHRELVREFERPIPLDSALAYYCATSARPWPRRLWYRLTREWRIKIDEPQDGGRPERGRRLYNVLPTRKVAPGEEARTRQDETRGPS